MLKKRRNQWTFCALYAAASLGLVVADTTRTSAPEKGRQVDRTALWQRTGRNVLWGFRNMYQPHVVWEPGSSYPFKMWFFGWSVDDGNSAYPGCDAIFFARGRDLDHWEVYSGEQGWDRDMRPQTWVPVVTADTKPWDSWHNGDPSVVAYRGRYYMAFSSTGFDQDMVQSGQPGDTDGDLMCIMGAVSKDGIHWRKSDRPILMHEADLGFRGENLGEEAITHGCYHRPSLMRDGGKWKLWFDYWAGKGPGVSMGYAENAGEFLKPRDWHVVRAGDDPLLPQWPNPDVIKVDGRYYSYADPPGYGQGWPSRQLVEAESPDGLHWTVLGWIRPDPDTPANQVPEAFVMKEAGQRWIVLFYACQIGGEPYNWRYDRIRYMRRPFPLRGAP